MTQFQLPYGTGYLTIEVPESFKPDLITPAVVQPGADPIGLVRQAIESPLGFSDLAEFGPIHSAAIAINDKTRPVPHELLLPPILSRLERLGLAPEQISLLIATGTHVPMPSAEFGKVLPREILDRYPVYSHDCDAGDLVNLGTTSRGTPIWTNRRFMQAGLRIVVGNIEPHHFMGYSGGVKTASIGLGGRVTINTNHAMLTHPNAITAHYADNPMRQDVEEIGARIGVHMAINAILNTDKVIVRVLAGNPVDVMGAGIPICRQICQASIDKPYDLVITSPGGHPKDINFYQSQKALTHAAMMTRDGGTILLLAACPDGSGSTGYERAMQGITSFNEVFEQFASTGFEVGPHKAYLVARDAVRVNILIRSEMTPEKVRSLLLTPVTDMDQTLSSLFKTIQPDSRIAILPYGTITIPDLLKNRIKL
jgi:lactate racemase